jgi:hypothetical protein
LTFDRKNLIYESHCDLSEIADSDVKGESIDEERHQEGCEEEGRPEEKGQVSASQQQNQVLTQAPSCRGLFISHALPA